MRRMGRYKKDIRDECVKQAKEGIHLKIIQQRLGPNPKATMRYLKKEGIDYHELLIKLKAEGKAPKTLIKLSRDKEKARKDKKRKMSQEEKPTEEVLEDL